MAKKSKSSKHRKDRFWWWVSAAVAGIVGMAIAAWLSGCQSSTTIKGGESTAKAVTEEVRPKTTTTTTITIQLPKEQK